MMQPKYRYRLPGRIHEAGFRTLTEFSKAVGVDLARISRICSGHDFPSQCLSHRMAEVIGVSLKEFLEWLTGEGVRLFQLNESEPLKGGDQVKDRDD